MSGPRIGRKKIKYCLMIQISENNDTNKTKPKLPKNIMKTSASTKRNQEIGKVSKENHLLQFSKKLSTMHVPIL